ncbi:hypothetical protein VNO78_25925 [Psophocarpus tetragonolobus]|uniref:Uncharacterized protein n=1 Tax=Psophocarpus tetragonolobus TaxID=3891 RepID=A0AAN9S6S1_PSOTE
MLNQNRNSKSFTRAKISPFLVALIVDQYLNDNNLPQTQFIFRHEASSLFADSLIDKELKSLLKLEMMLDEYMSLKQYKGMLDQQMIEVMQEKHRIRLLLQSLQNSIHLYNIPSSASPNDTIMKNNSAVVSQPRLCTNTPSGVSTATQSQPVSLRNNVETQNFSSPMISLSGKKRKDTQTINVPAVTKRPRGRPPSRKLPIQVLQCLNDNNLSKTRFIFRNKASSLFTNSSINESFLSLEDIFDEYICLKDQTGMLD